jgi:L-iditol 2-dehydrogenase
VFECTGVQSSVVTASYVPRPAGEVIVIGVGKAVMNELPFMHLSMAEVSGILQTRMRKVRY